MIPSATYLRPLYRVLLLDANGAGVTGIAPTDANLRIAHIGDGSSSPTVCAGGSTVEAVATVGVYQAPTTATRVRWREVDAANLPGLYEIHLPTSVHGVHPMQIRVWDAAGTPRWVDTWGATPVLPPVDVMSINGIANNAVILTTLLIQYDSAGFLDANVTSIQPNVITATAIASNAITDAKIASGALTASKFASGAFDAVWAVGTRTLTSFGSLVADVWAHATRTLTSIADSAGVTTLLSRLTSGRATNLDNLDATVSSRLAASGYTAPANADVAAIKGKTDALVINSGRVDANIEAVNGVVVQGDGTSGNKWRPV